MLRFVKDVLSKELNKKPTWEMGVHTLRSVLSHRLGEELGGLWSLD